MQEMVADQTNVASSVILYIFLSIFFKIKYQQIENTMKSAFEDVFNNS